jgi:hypothetical protein
MAGPSGRAGLRPLTCLRLWVRIPPGAWMSVSCTWCVLSSRGLCVGLINSCSKLNCSNPQLLTTISATNLIPSFNISGSIKSVSFYSRFLIETFYGFPSITTLSELLHWSVFKFLMSRRNTWLTLNYKDSTARRPTTPFANVCDEDSFP